MTRSILAVVVLASTIPSARAGETEGASVEIIRPARTRPAPAPEPKELELTPSEAEAAPAPEQAKAEPRSTKKDDDAQARAQAERIRQLEELSRQTQEEYRKAANALVGGE